MRTILVNRCILPSGLLYHVLLGLVGIILVLKHQTSCLSRNTWVDPDVSALGKITISVREDPHSLCLGKNIYLAVVGHIP